ncbi:MAG: T9SS type A sorting domain-containing protein [Psychroserpens sp.]|uniref:GEVED domain-containing protein n=1 Tax=Psychroserpens sp. TaxID=2020870 RepID=UPI001B193D11|nr:GEVED domain-containing protein [Psychroserpens sp.]MBO6654884.1 T9SS type A sorting domain-containing protein [Psychroserpens sp.]MBO6683042.1 T9SS type A sorting domain-containing protein [Psychroserpens sp.]MBO6751347.1 T9SS type A sorting domain-containing protein [Psychroserpens sp.]MBO6943693.1 T9SS type A sorting domain-containing protein [Psychroserpens sp.]
MNATALTVNSSPTCTTSSTGTTVGATQSQVGCTGSADDDVWYSFQATNTTHEVTAVAGTLYDVVLEVFSGTCGTLASLACQDANYPLFGDPDEEIITLTGLTIGTTYYVRVYSWEDDIPFFDRGTFDICVTTPSSSCTGNPITDTPDLEYITNVSFLGTLQDTSNTSTFSTGYEDYTGLATISSQIEGEGINVYVEGFLGGRIKAWIDWNSDGAFDDDPSTELVYDSTIITFSTTFGFQIPFGTPPGDYTIRIRTFIGFDYLFGIFFNNYDFNACEDFLFDGGLLIEYFGEAEDYLFNVQPRCTGEITSVADGETCGPGIATLTATGTGTSYNWYASDNPSDTTVLSTSNTYSPSISSTTTFYVTAFDSATSCESIRIPVVAEYNPVPTLSVTPDATNRVVCGENDALEITATGDVDRIHLINEDFSSNLGIFSNQVEAGNTSTNPASEWQQEVSVFIPSEQVWFPAISSGFGSNGFVMSNSDVGDITHQSLQSASVNTTDFNNLTLEMRMYYSHFTPDGAFPTFDFIAIEVSENNGAWTSVTGNLTSTPALILDVPGGNIVGDVGIGTEFQSLVFDLSAHVDIANLRIRVRYYGEFQDGIALDDIELYGDKDITSVDWSTTPAGIIDLYIDTDNDNIGDTPYVSGAYTTIYAIPNLSQLEQSTYSFTINASLANSCGSANLPFTVINNTKIWDGSQSTSTWNDAQNWSPAGIPTSDNCVIVRDVSTFPDPVLLGPPIPPTPAFAKNLKVKSNGYLELESSTNLTITQWIEVEPNGVFDVRSGANLVQVNNVASNNNAGNINVEREVTGLNSQDYVYWSSAVENFGVLGVSPGTNPALVLNWIPTVGGNGVGNYGEWQSTIENMTVGKGYAIRGLSGTSTANTARFTGRPSNGIINRAITRGSYNGGTYPGAGSTVATAIDDNWNLVGNPYPSSISADDFITTNAAVIVDDTDPLIDGTIYLWTHSSAPSNAVTDPFYGDYVYNYNPNDYIAYNLTGSTPAGFNGFIAAGQAFFVLMDHAAPSPSNLEFNNLMRSGVYDNNQFYRSEDSESPTNTAEKHRIWLDLINQNNQAVSTLVGYVTNATNDEDRLFDGDYFSGSNMSIYSMITDRKFLIQGRSLPFIETDLVPLGINIPQTGSYVIAINQVDGLFNDEDQNIYLEDLYTSTIHNLRINPYNFTSESGDFTDRFVLRYTDDTLSIAEINSNNTLHISAPNSDYIYVTSDLHPITSIEVFDILGHKVYMNDHINSNEFRHNPLSLSAGTYLVKAKTLQGIEKTEKIILK